MIGKVQNNFVYSYPASVCKSKSKQPSFQGIQRLTHMNIGMMPEGFIGHVVLRNAAKNTDDFVSVFKKFDCGQERYFFKNDKDEVIGEFLAKIKKYFDYDRIMYKEDPSKTLRWFILEDQSPECRVPMEDFHEAYGRKWEEEPEFQEDELWTVLRAEGDEVDRCLRHWLLDEEQVRKTLATRSNLSAHGVDGIGYAVWKADSEMTAKMITRTIKLMLRHRQFSPCLSVNPRRNSL